MRTITTAERRVRLGARHHVAPLHRASAIDEVARDLVCLHATDPASVYLSAWYAALLDDVADVKRWLREAESETLRFLHEHGEASAQELSAAVPALARKVRVNVGKKYEGDIGMSSRILIVLALEGRIVRGRPRGTWLSTQYRWATVEDWLGGPIAEVPVATAQASLIERWLGRFGPGTEQDMRWWTGLSAREVRAALTSIDAVAVDLGDESGFLLPSDLAPTPPLEPWVALLPSLDPTTMGWRSRDWYLGAYKAAIFDSMGNAGPTIWCDGRIVGGWAIRQGAVVATRLLEDVGSEAASAIETEAGRVSRLLAGVQVYPRFASPIHRELAPRT